MEASQGRQTLRENIKMGKVYKKRGSDTFLEDKWDMNYHINGIKICKMFKQNKDMKCLNKK